MKRLIKKFLILLPLKNYIQLCCRLQDLYFNFKFLCGFHKHIEYEGSIPFGDKICVFAAYPAKGFISKALIHYLNSLKELGFSILFISNQDINSDGIEELKPYCTKIVIRDNFGIDFGAYKLGITYFAKQIQNSSQLLIANDGVIGPIVDMKPMFEEMNGKNLDFWGTSSADCYPAAHLCSFFVVFNRRVISSKLFQGFWSSYKLTSFRPKVISQGEVLLTHNLKQYFSWGSYISKSKIYDRLRQEPLENMIALLSNNFKELHCNFSSVKRLEDKALFEAFLKDKILFHLERRNPYGLVFPAMLALGMPLIKKDIIRKRLYSEVYIVNVLNKLALVMAIESIISEMDRCRVYESRKLHYLWEIGVY